MRIDVAMADPEVFEPFLSSIREWADVMQAVLPERVADPADDIGATEQ